MHSAGTLRALERLIHLRRQSLQSPRALRPCGCIKTPALNLRASTTAQSIQRQPSRFKTVLVAAAICAGAGLGYLYITDTRADAHRWLGPPLVRFLWPDAEDAHKGGVEVLKKLYRFGLHPRERGGPDDAKDLETEVFGHTLVNPIGISSGLDKHGEIPTQLFALGPAVVEIGGVTETRQSGNPRPRVFRVVSQRGMLNRYGLNSEGAERVAARLRQRVRDFAYDQGYGVEEDAERLVLDGDAGVPPGSLVKGKLLAVQVAKNTSTPEGDIEGIRRDYARAASLLARYADIIVVNISCPNAPGFRELQRAESLTRILTGVVGAAASADRKSRPAVMVKAGLDEDTEEQVATICAAVWASGVDGVIVGNTTTSRPERTGLSKSEAALMDERGGYSGPQLFPRTVSLVKKYRQVLDQPLHEPNGLRQTQLQQPRKATGTRIGTLFKHDGKDPEAGSNESIDPGVIRVPKRHSSFLRTRGTEPDTAPGPSASQHLEHSLTSKGVAQPATLTPKVIFCTGGITNGQQALEVLDAGASVAQIYTGKNLLSVKLLINALFANDDSLRQLLFTVVWGQ